VTVGSTEAPYTLRNIEEMLGLGRSVVAGLIAAGFVSPARGARNEYRFTFQDVVLLRTAHRLRAAKVPPRRLLRSLKDLRAKLPASLPLSGLRIKAVGNEVAVRDRHAQWEVESGQLLMDFEVAADHGSVAFIEHAQPEPTHATRSAEEHFARGVEGEAADPAAAEQAYRDALAVDPVHTSAAVNLAALLCEAGRCAEAIDVCTRALESAADEPLLHFNLAIALEDAGRTLQALRSYEACLRLDPKLADAHFNAARLHERLGRKQEALRHYSAYRRLANLA
jgi:tetratricopeptide (TPR) repeat protein